MTWWETALVFVTIAAIGSLLVMAGADRLFNHVDVPEDEDETAPDPSAPGNAPYPELFAERSDDRPAPTSLPGPGESSPR